MERRIIKTRQPLSIEIRKTIVYLIITLTIMIIGFSAYFLLQTGSATQRGYMLKQLQLQNEDLRKQNEDLDEQLMKITSFPAIEKNPAFKRMQEALNKVYINTKGGSR